MNLSNCNRCLEEGAEKFFLKPVRLSDLNKLKPHVKNTKLKNQQEEKVEKLENTQVQQLEQIQPNHPQFQFLQLCKILFSIDNGKVCNFIFRQWKGVRVI